MKKYHLALACYAIAGIIASCTNSKNEPINPQEYRISSITSDDTHELFNYNTSEQISNWEYKEEGASFNASYSYIEEENAIEIASEEKFADTRIFNEKLYLNQNGLADHAKGTVVIKSSNGEQMMKNYTVDFHYNSSCQLSEVNIAEKTTNETGWEASKALEWTAELEWDDNNLIQYREYTNPEHPMIEKEYNYFGLQQVKYMPIVQGCIIRTYYLPLQYQGILGKQSESLVKNMTVHSTTHFSYDIGTTIYTSNVERYTEIRNDKETIYTVKWEPKKK